MSDSGGDSDEEVLVVKKPKVQMSAAEIASRIANNEIVGMSNDASKPSQEENINVSQEYMELERPVDATKEEMLAEFDRRRKARNLTLPTDDSEVKAMLRQLSQPICLFGEDKPERRERLRTVLSLLTEEEKQEVLGIFSAPAKIERKEDQETWYHEGSQDLRRVRVYFAKFSLPRARDRLDRMRKQRDVSSQQKMIKMQETHKWIRNMTNYCSQIGDTRPLSSCQFSPNSQYLATGSWTGLCKLWSVPSCEPLKVFRGHNAQVGCIAFHPRSTIDLEPHIMNLASCDQEGAIKLWTMEEEIPVGEIEGHAPYRVSRLAFHPSGRFLASCCFDNSWRLFDLEENEEILFQEGHSKPVYDIAFQNDGAIALTGGLDAYGRAWDLRTGRCIMFLEGHLRGILSVAFAPNGYIMATGSQDNTVKIWDLRVRKCIYTIPAHQSLVSKLKFEENSGDYLISSSYDTTTKLWTNPGWAPLKTLKGHDNKVTCVDVSPDSKWIVTSSFDRTFKLWAPES